jgi:ABC-2 type transport system ATP-binding protein
LFGVDSREAVSRREIGFLPEAPYFYEYLTARETVAFYARLSGMDSAKIPARAGEVLERVGLTSAADRPVRTYSRGMRQRLGLAQAIVHGPKLAILDEPMSGLDPLGRRDVRLLILELAAGGVTVFFSSHILSDIEALCDRVGVVSSGTLVAHGSVQELASPRVTAVEIRCTGISTAAIEGLSPARVRDDAGLLTFEVRDEQTADRAARLVIEKGGVLKSLQPVRESLEDVFSRLQVAGTGVAGPEPKGGAQ